MLMSHSKKFIFVHVYKTGGTSVKYALKDYDNVFEPAGVGRSTLLAGLRSDRFDKHVTAAELKAQLPNEIFQDYFKFMFVRNPWDRQVSQYHYYLQKKDHPQHNTVSQIQSFEEYLKWRVSGEVRQQKIFCCDSDGRILVDFVGKFETLEHDFEKICGLIGASSVKLPRLNASAHDAYRVYYNDKTKNLIYDAYREDIELFGYEF